MRCRPCRSPQLHGLCLSRGAFHGVRLYLFQGSSREKASRKASWPPRQKPSALERESPGLPAPAAQSGVRRSVLENSGALGTGASPHVDAVLGSSMGEHGDNAVFSKQVPLGGRLACAGRRPLPVAPWEPGGGGVRSSSSRCLSGV